MATVSINSRAESFSQAKSKFQPTGHFLGFAYGEIELANNHGRYRMVFSGDLDAPYTPLFAMPQRSQPLKIIIEKAVADNGVVLIPAFSIGLIQELLY